MSRSLFKLVRVIFLASLLSISYFIFQHAFSFPSQVFAGTTCHCTIDGPTCVSEGGTPSGQGPCSGTFIMNCCITTCPVSTTCTWIGPPYNDCSAKNYYQACTRVNADCSKSSWDQNYTAVDNCAGPRYKCVPSLPGKCDPFWSISGQVTDSLNGGGVGGIGVNVSYGLSGSTDGSGNYGWSYVLPSGCYSVSISLLANYILTGLGSIPFCVGGDKVVNFTVTRVYSISGKVYDPANNKGIPNIPVSVAGHSTKTDGNGNYTFPYSDHIVRGTYTVKATVPPCWHGLTTSQTVTVGPDLKNVYLTMTRQYTIAGNVYDPYNNNKGVGGVAVLVDNSKTTKTDGNGNYLFTCAFDILAGTHTVSITIPSGYTNTTVTSQTVTVGPNWSNNAVKINFGITKLFTINGNIFVDPNINGKKDGNESNYAVQPKMSFTNTSLPISKAQESITTRGDGSYTINNAITSDITVSYLSLPAGYYMTSPLNGPPPSFRVHVGFGCSTNGAPGAQCNYLPPPLSNGANIDNLDFGIIDDQPWFQSVCGDIRDDSGFSNPEAAGQQAIITSPTCTNPGIVFTGNSNAQKGKGQYSSKNWLVGGSPPNYSEVFNSGTNKILTSYDYLLEKATSANIPMKTLGCSTCDLSGLGDGLYTSNGNVTLKAATLPAGNHYIFLIKQTLTIDGDIHVPNSSSAVFATGGDIIIAKTVGTDPATRSNAPNIEGIYSTDKSFIMQNTAINKNQRITGTCKDLRLNLAGALYVNTSGTGGQLTDNRNLCRFNAVEPQFQITQRLDLLLNMPEFVRNQLIYSQEVAP